MIGSIEAIIIAAGKGTRLAGGNPSPLPKVLYEIGGKPIISYTLELLKKVGLNKIIIVVGHQSELVKKAVGKDYKFAFQPQQLGTGHAVKTGLSEVSPQTQHVLVINGDDSAFYRPETIQKVVGRHLEEQNTLTFVTIEVEYPSGLGRVIRKDGKLVRIVEENEASEEEKKIKEVNDGVYIFNRAWLEKNISKIKKSPSGEYYLVDLIGLAAESGERIEAVKLPNSSEWRGINTTDELKLADQLKRKISDNAPKK